MKRSSSPKEIPYKFVLEELQKLRPVVRPMFGCYAIYNGEKIVAALRKKQKDDPDNGMWLATTHEHHASLRNNLPSMRSIRIFGTQDSGWQILPEDSHSFEEEALKACELIIKGDVRIGKVPKTKKKKNA